MSNTTELIMNLILGAQGLLDILPDCLNHAGIETAPTPANGIVRGGVTSTLT
jgi:hypothetical protein